jgi:hypothetical protein
MREVEISWDLRGIWKFSKPHQIGRKSGQDFGNTVSIPPQHDQPNSVDLSEMVRTSAASIHVFTGNNIGPKGDLASRSLQVRLDTDRVDPENRNFQHPDPIGWTRKNREKILQAL